MGTEKSFFFIPLYDERLTLPRGYYSWARTADALIFDLEDSLAPNKKASGRALLAKCWARFQNLNKVNFVRINSDRDEQVLDLIALAPLKNKIILIPKVENVEAVTQVLRESKSSEVAVFLETPIGIIQAEKIAALDSVKYLFFGPEDLSLRLGVDPTEQNMTYGAAKIINAAAAFKKSVVGCAGAFRFIGEDGLKRFAGTLRYSRGLGFTGCYAIHHSQIVLINQIFSETEFSSVELEQKLKQNSDQAVLVLDNELIGPPMRSRYRSLLKSLKK